MIDVHSLFIVNLLICLLRLVRIGDHNFRPAEGGAIANVSATAAILLALGVHRDAAINFGLASGLLLCGTAEVATIVGVAASSAIGLRAHLTTRAAA
jgi:hypothetical protein